MLFTLTTQQNLDLIKARLYKNARRTVLLYKTSATEENLNNYLVKHYGTNLKLACLSIINSALYSTDTNNTIVVTFRTKYLDDLASLITYGNESVQGSNILKDAFCRE